MHDASLGHSLAQVIDPSWLDTKVVAGRILSKILAEIHADGPIKNSQMEDLLEEDDERFVFQNLLYQEHTDEEDSDLYAAVTSAYASTLKFPPQRKDNLRPITKYD